MHISVGRQIAAEGAQQPVAAVGIGHAAGLAREHRRATGTNGFVGAGDHKNRIGQGTTRRAFHRPGKCNFSIPIIIEVAHGVKRGTDGGVLPDSGRGGGEVELTFQQGHRQQVHAARVGLPCGCLKTGIANQYVIVTVAIDVSGYNGCEGAGNTRCASASEGE